MNYAIPEQFAAANKAYIESMLSMANTAFAGAERLAALNLNTARSLLEDSVANAKTLFAIEDVQELLSTQKTLARPTLENFFAYSRSIYEIGSETQKELAKALEAQYGELNKNIGTALEEVAKSAPAGSDVAIAAVKSAIAAANSAYGNMNKAARQAAEIAEANVTAATNVVVKAAGSGGTQSPKGKKAAHG